MILTQTSANSLANYVRLLLAGAAGGGGDGAGHDEFGQGDLDQLLPDLVALSFHAEEKLLEHHVLGPNLCIVRSGLSQLHRQLLYQLLVLLGLLEQEVKAELRTSSARIFSMLSCSSWPYIVSIFLFFFILHFLALSLFLSSLST